MRIQAIGAGLSLWLFAAAANAAIPQELYQAGDTDGVEGTGCEAFTTPPLNFLFCDDGRPVIFPDGTNEGGLKAITVPAEYEGDGYTGLPRKKTPTTAGGADTGGNIALDVDISWPLTPPPAEGYPMLFFMHGCCSGNKTSWESRNVPANPMTVPPTLEKLPTFDERGERWHYNNAWFASRGYVVVTYTSRGFATNGPSGPNRLGSTGQTQIDSRRFEINDFQSLACQIYANADEWNAVTGQTIKINPNAVVVTGGSYGGGFSWMALTDPVWTCNIDTGADGQKMKLAAAAPRYGWTDLVYSLVPTGRHSALPSALPKTDGCDSGPRKPDKSDCETPVPVGVPKQSINAGLYATGLSGANFPASITEAQTCLSGAYPSEDNPSCAGTLSTVLPEFLEDRSAYYQQQWFDKIVSDPEYRIPVFSAGTLTDPLFPPHEHRRMHNRIRSLVPNYPLQAYFGDYQHFVQNKDREWGDICGGDRHVCTNTDYGSNFNAAPATLVRTGITTRLNRFIDHYAKPSANPTQAVPSFDVTAALQVCPQKATETQKADEPGETYTAATFEALSKGSVQLDSGGDKPTLTVGAVGGRTSYNSGGGTHADPVATDRAAASPQPPAHGRCSTRLASDPAPAGVAQYTSPVLTEDLIMLGTGVVAVAFTGEDSAESVQLHARLYELLPNGNAVMADRGFRRLSQAEVDSGSISFELFGNGWKFSKGNRIRLELMQDDSPYLKASQPPSSLTISRVVLKLSTRSSGSGPLGGDGITRFPSSGGALALGLLAGLLAMAGLRRRYRRS